MGVFVSRSEQLQGARVGAYEIARLIGHGATASVFEARHVALGKPVAIKILHEHVACDEQIRGRFVREGRVAASLRHPNIVDVIDVGEEGQLPYLVMELLVGTDLRRFLADVRLLDIHRALAFLLPIASALAQAHDARVLHRDLKPANIFLARDVRDDVVPKLVDFGLSKSNDAASTSSLTQADLVAGTVLYMAPEQTRGVKHSSPASDQYALAAILYESITGEPPIQADGLHALLDAIREEPIRPPCDRNPRIPEAMSDVILRGLARDPAKRFSSMRAFGAALLPYADEATRHALERDFAERISGTARTPSSRPSIVKAIAEAQTRFENDGQHSESAVMETSQRAGNAPLPCAPGAGPFRIKGIGYRGVLHLVSKLVPGGVDELCTVIDDPRLVAFLHQPFLAATRYDIFPMVPLTAALSRVTGTSFDSLVRSGAIGQARYDARTVFKRVFDTNRVERIAERLDRFGAQYYDFGKFGGRIVAPHRFELTHAEIPAYIAGWHVPQYVAYTLESAKIVGATSITCHSTENVDAGFAHGYALITSRSVFEWTE